jgi:serine/threonine protein kinase
MGLNLKSDEPCAIKIYKDLNEQNVNNLTREVGILQQLPHENIIQLMDYIEVENLNSCSKITGGKPFEPEFKQELQGIVVLEFANCGDLIHHIVSGGKFDLRLAKALFKQII